ncbi:MAG: RNA 2',3'-cyclic phosphodiesterase [Syntrophaceticus schinkii]|nr:RNA 2',3'-cyclic phosphodiesterase [Syntrophaceticus schinkii]MDD4262314.1 RNA 2',3'-cyclic phosphodiesterase [Syntrophaceticus schinkii]
MSDLTRSFIAVLLQPEIKRGIYQSTASLYQLPLDIKWVEEENYHFTLKFFGSLTQEEIEKVKTFLEAFTAAIKPFYLQCGELMVFPNWRSPRVLSLSLKGEIKILQGLWHNIETGLADIGFLEEKRKRFNPHITLGRFRSGNDALEKMIRERAGHIPDEKFLVQELYLMASKLTPEGPEYTALARYPFQVKE